MADLVAGFRYLGRHRILRPVTVGYAILFIGIGLTSPAEVALSADFGVGDTGYAMLTCLFALGGIAGTGLASRGLLCASRQRQTAILAGASAALSVGFLIVGAAPIFAVALAGMAVAGAADGVWMVAHENLVQSATPDAIRSRVFAGSEAVYLGGISLGLVVAGTMISLIGAAGTFEVGAAGSLVACLVLFTTAISSARTAEVDQGGRRTAAAKALPFMVADPRPEPLGQPVDQRGA